LTTFAPGFRFRVLIDKKGLGFQVYIRGAVKAI
jgi:hypothetical protein